MSAALEPKVLVLGGGPGGYVAAIRCGQLGLDTVLVEAKALGGTCLNVGCIPSKAIIHAATQFETMRQAHESGVFGLKLAAAPEVDFAATVVWKDQVVGRLTSSVAGLLKRAGVRVVTGWGTFSDGKTCVVETADGPVEISAEHVILAAGSEPVELPSLPFGGRVISSSEALSLDTVPNHLAVVGAGYIGLELGSAFRKLGAEVTVVEVADRILPLYDQELTGPVAKWLQNAGVSLRLGTKAQGLAKDGLVVATPDGGKETIGADTVLVTVGRRPRTAGWGLETMAIDMDGPFVKVDDRCATSMRNVWAVGDLTGEPMLEHKAAAQGEMVAELIAGRRRRFDPVAIAAVCFTEPEIVTVGLSPGEAEARGLDVISAKFPFAANGRSLSMGGSEGFARVVAARQDHRILGIQAVGAHIADLSGEFALALEMGAVLEDIAGTIHAHPTLTEALHEASLRGLGHAIHI